MAKKNGFNVLYLMGMIAVIIGSLLPVIVLDYGVYGKVSENLLSALESIDFLNAWYTIIMVAAAVAGIVIEIINPKKEKLIRIILLIVSVICGILLLIDKGFLQVGFKVLGAGFYIIIVGWAIAAFDFME